MDQPSDVQETAPPRLEVPQPRRVDPIRSPAGRYRSSMLRRFGLLYWLSSLGLLMRRVRFEEHSAENIRRAASRGPLVYALHTQSLLDWLALNTVLNRNKLPLASFTTGVVSTPYRPVLGAVREWWGALRARATDGPMQDPVASGWLSRVVAGGMTTCVFLVRPGLVSGALGREEANDVVGALISAQASGARSIQVVPVVALWRRAAPRRRDNVTRFLIGNEDEPSALQKLWMILSGRGLGIVQAGAAVDLGELVERYPDASPRRRTRAARMLLRRYLYREAHVVRGPRMRPHRWMRRIVLDSSEVRALVAEEARASGRSEAEIRRSVDGLFDHMAARMQYAYVRFGEVVCGLIFKRLYTGVDLRPEDAERLRAAMRSGTPILMPCHKSHLDYLLLSWVMYQHDLALPHIVAGENLSFFPLGAFFRRAGAFFIRRSFKGDRVFPVVFERYLRQLIHDGFPVEFFVEGGRSRTGKLLPPKLGVLGMVMDAAWRERGQQGVTLLPIAISYERIAEEGAYARELAGEKKQKEDLGQLVRAGSVLGKRYGKVYLRVGEALPATEVFAGIEDWTTLEKDQKRERLQYAGERVLYRIAQEQVILPTTLTALGLMAQTRRGIRIADLNARCHRLQGLVRARGASLATSIEQGGWAVQEALRRFERAGLVKRLEDEEGDILQVVDDKRITLEFYKNGLLHFVVPVGLVAAAVRALVESGAPISSEALTRLFEVQVFLLRYEFTLDPEESLDAVLEAAVRDLLDYGALVRDAAGGLLVADKRRVGELAEIVRNFHEGYMLVLLAARALRSRDIPLEELARRMQEWGQARLAVDELRRPEALSMVGIRNAIHAFREEGVLQVRSGGGGLQFDERAWTQYIADLRMLLLLTES